MEAQSKDGRCPVVSTMSSTNNEQPAEQPPGYHESNRQTQQYQLEQLPRQVNTDGSSHDSPDGKKAKPLESQSAYFYFLLAFYSALAMASWIIICRIGRKGSWGSEEKNYGDFKIFSNADVAGRWLHGALVMSTLAAMLTIPTTAAICAYAAVPFAQYHARNKNLTLRQTAMLADEGWRSPRVLAKLLFPSHRAKVGSRFLWIASMLTILGAYGEITVVLVLYSSFQLLTR